MGEREAVHGRLTPRMLWTTLEGLAGLVDGDTRHGREVMTRLRAAAEAAGRGFLQSKCGHARRRWDTRCGDVRCEVCLDCGKSLFAQPSAGFL